MVDGLSIYMPVTGALKGLSAAQLAELKESYFNCLIAISKNQSYTVNNISYNRAKIPEVKDILAEIEYAQKLSSGTLTTRKFADFRQR